MNKRWRLVAAVLATALMIGGLGACGDDKDSDSSGSVSGTGSGSNAGGESDGSGSANNTLKIEQKEYAFGVTGTAVAGNVTLDVHNTGKEFHMLALGKLKAGKKISDISDAVNKSFGGGKPPQEANSQSQDQPAGGDAGAGEGEGGGGDPFEALLESGETEEHGELSAFLSPGQTQANTGKLEAGTYAILCFIPTEGEGVPHLAKGMYGTFEVKEGESKATTPKPTAEYTIEKDKPLTGPATLKAGDNVLEVKTKGKGHQFLVAQLQPGKTVRDADDFFTKLFEGQEPPPKGVAAQSPATIVASTFEIAEGTDAYVRVNLKPGTYYFVCNGTDNGDDDNPSNDVDHFDKETITVTVS